MIRGRRIEHGFRGVAFRPSRFAHFAAELVALARKRSTISNIIFHHQIKTKDICVIGMPDQIAMYRAKAGTNCFSRVYLAMYTAATRHLY